MLIFFYLFPVIILLGVYLIIINILSYEKEINLDELQPCSTTKYLKLLHALALTTVRGNCGNKMWHYGYRTYYYFMRIVEHIRQTKITRLHIIRMNRCHCLKIND